MTCELNEVPGLEDALANDQVTKGLMVAMFPGRWK